MTVKNHAEEMLIRSLFPGQRIALVPDVELHNYGTRTNQRIPYTAYNTLKEPVLIADYGKDHAEIGRYYPTVRYVVDLKGRRVYHTRTRQWEALAAAPLPGREFPFWTLFLSIAGLAAFILLFAYCM
jgi:hypothetical protein